MTDDPKTISVASDAGVHFAAGLFFSLLDYFTSKISDKKVDRVEALKQCLISIDILLAPPEQRTVDPASTQYALTIHAVRDYFIRTGIIKEKAPLSAKIGSFFRNEKLNALTFVQKAYVTVVVESLDTLVGMGYYSHWMNKGPVGSFMLNIYQMPMFCLGLYAAKYLVRNPIEWLTTVGEERKMRKTIENAAKNTPIVDLVLNYKPQESVVAGLKEQGKTFSALSLTERGKGLYKAVQALAAGAAQGAADAAKKAVDGVAEYARQQSRKAEEEKLAAKTKFDTMTKGR